MLKFAFMINVPGYTPETFSTEYDSGESITRIVGTDNMDMAVEYAGKLAAEGFNLFNLCGDFDEEITEKIRQAVGEGVKVKNATYSPEETEKLEKLEEFSKYGIIAIASELEEDKALEVTCPDLYAKMWLVKDAEQASVAAEELSKEGMHAIELCSWFDAERTAPIIKAVNSETIPVGSCGY